MFLIAGLGNPSSRYEKTRHNIGFDVIDAVSDRYNIEVKEKKAKALCGSGFIEGQKVLLVKPQTYMNLSGDSISALTNFYKLDPARELIVIYDDISLDPGNIRIRKKGSAGGHNGVKDIIAKIGTDQFPRIKVGVGAKPENWDLADYVLSRFSQGERRLVDEAAAESVEALALMVQGRIEEAMNLYNRKKTVKESNDGNSL
ncbi:MAG TPA: aminoacyl-tRNA hydrolase [Candidatus Eubacterium avistercoris]|uniref:Peptidyl-tRNA hydrolase n=1 Tax=Candidatus Eubacterium avistercoris TaxID=2838567 RepID=A0A9D2D3L3_9FIRM|nr:aminoacyl-tRNA hydrolase [Candidatus Eubacterium avistercoris]